MAALTKWNPFEDLWTLSPRELLGRLKPGDGAEFEWSPRCDVTETEDAIVVHAEIPGVEAKDLEVTIQGSSLVVRGEKRVEKSETAKGRSYSERFFGSFERAVPIPEGVDESAIEARLKDGVLEVRVPLPAASKAEPRKIAITVA